MVLKLHCAYMKSESTFSCLQGPETGLSSKPFECSSNPHTPFRNVYFNIISLQAPSDFFPPRVCDQNFPCFSYLSNSSYISHLSHFPWLDHPSNIWWRILFYFVNCPVLLFLFIYYVYSIYNFYYLFVN